MVFFPNKSYLIVQSAIKRQAPFIFERTTSLEFKWISFLLEMRMRFHKKMDPFYLGLKLKRSYSIEHRNNYVIPVSYTHLDVYKRQVHHYPYISYNITIIICNYNIPYVFALTIQAYVSIIIVIILVETSEECFQIVYCQYLRRTKTFVIRN